MGFFQTFIQNLSSMRDRLFRQNNDPRRDYNKEFGYPDVVTVAQYRDQYDREGLATRIVNVMPEECWIADPEIVEVEDEDTETEFETTWRDLNDIHHFLHYLQRVDEMSGVGHYGIILIGLNDGKTLEEPVDGISDKEEATGKNSYEITFLRVFDEFLAPVAKYETDPQSPRYGKPILYNLTLADLREQAGTGAPVAVPAQVHTPVHWTRVVHIADNRRSSEVSGVPRLENVYNRVLDVLKIAGGSGEMYWRGALPGYAFETDPTIAALGAAVELDEDKMKQQFEDYANGLQRFMAISGVTTKQLMPQIADPTNHIEAQLKLICVAKGIPWRVFVGSEQGQLASGQDRKNWNRRVSRRQTGYLTPMVIRPFADRLIAYGVLPEPAQYLVKWPPIEMPDDTDKATAAKSETDALAAYVSGGVDVLFPPLEYLTKVLGYSLDEAQAIIDAAKTQLTEGNVIQDHNETTTTTINPMFPQPGMDPNNPNAPEKLPGPTTPPPKNTTPAPKG